MNDTQPDERLPATDHDVTNSGSKNKVNLHLSFDYRVIIVVLLLAIVGMLIVWKPWAPVPVGDRTVSVTGDASLEATPDEYVFTPSYDFTNADKQAALSALTEQSNTVIAKLKALGVTASQIKTDTMGGEPYYTYVTNDDNSSTYTLEFTVTVDSSALAQKVQDYLTTTSPSGSVSPDVNFSDATQKSLDSQARDIATKDARKKAEQSATNLGFKIGAVKSVTDGTGFIRPLPYAVGSTDLAAGGAVAQPSLAVQPGQNKVTYSVDVVYFIH